MASGVSWAKPMIDALSCDTLVQSMLTTGAGKPQSPYGTNPNGRSTNRFEDASSLTEGSMDL
jgi:hypothetical protein